MFLDIDGQLVHVVDHGTSGVPVVGMAGVFGNVEIWQQPFERLHRRRRTVAYDHYGTGLTDVPPRLVTFDSQVALVGRLLDMLEIDVCVLAGDSSFSAVAVAAAARWPDRVGALALVAAKVEHVPDDRTRGFVTGLRRAFEPTLDAFVQLCLPEDERGHLRRWLHAIIARTGPVRAAALVESFYDIDVRPMLADVRAPTLVLHGVLDVINPPEGALELARSLPDASLQLLDAVGHVPTLSQPEVVADAIEAMARRVDGRGDRVSTVSPPSEGEGVGAR